MRREMSKKDRLSKIIVCSLVLGVMMIIFMFSNQPSNESNHLSSQFVSGFQSVIRFIPFLPSSIKNKLLSGAGFYVRKVAHMAIYTLLGAATWTALRQINIKRRSVRRTLIIGIIYACLDEFHQYFIAGRSAKLGDVVIDTIGICLGIFLARVISGMIKYNEKHRKSQNKRKK